MRREAGTTHLLQYLLFLGQSGDSLETVPAWPAGALRISLSGLWAFPPPFSSLYICLMNISISRAQLFPLNKQSADFIAGLLLTYLFGALNHPQETLGKVESGILATGPSCQHLPCRPWGCPIPTNQHDSGNETPIIQRPESEAC